MCITNTHITLTCRPHHTYMYVTDILSRISVRRPFVAAAWTIASAVATEHTDHADIMTPDVSAVFTHHWVVLFIAAALLLLLRSTLNSWEVT